MVSSRLAALPALLLLALGYAAASSAPHLFDSNFEHITQAATGQTTGVWVIKFCSQKSVECQQLEPVWEPLVDEMREQQVFLAVVDVDDNPKLAKRFHVHRLPTILLLRDQKMFVFPVTAFSDVAAGLREFVARGYESAHSMEVPPPAGHSFGDMFAELRSHLGLISVLLAALAALGIFAAFAHTVTKDKRE